MPRRRAALLLSLCPVFGAALPAAADIDFFERKVRPLLVEHCYECHSSQGKIKAGLRLDHRAGWQTGGDSGPAIIPGDPAASLLMRAVGYQDRDLKMPPQKKLPASMIDVLREWIAQGAPDPREADPVASAKTHAAASPGTLWSFQPLARPEPRTRAPAVKDSAWPRDPVDHHLLAALEQAGLHPVHDATPEALLRRLYFDLTGLPPTADEIAQAAQHISRFETTVDRLLASTAFAERWAQHWLDITRFAESSGGGRTLPFKDAWRFRDYVIESLHADIPLDQLITEHIAGDLLQSGDPRERRRQLTATAFLALGPTNYEEQDKGLLRMDIIDEQLETIGRSFMGLTIGCARCHDHKFDPVTAHDYYALAGIFRSTQTLKNYTDNVAKWIDKPLPLDPEEEHAMRQKEQQLAFLESELNAITAAVKKLQPSAETLPPGRPVPPSALPGIVLDDSDAMLQGPWQPSTNFPNYIGTGYIHDGKTAKGQCTATFTPAIPKTGRYEVRVAFTASPGRDKRVPVHILHADGEEDLHIDQSLTPPIDARFVSLGTYRFEKDGAGFILVSNEGTTGHVTLDAVWLLDDETRAREESDRAARNSPELAAALAEQRRLESEIKQAKAQGPVRPETMSVIEDEKPADCPLHIRGNIRNLGPAIPRGFIEALTLQDSPVIPPNQSGRLQLAQWITHPQHPLTARVLVNRVWMHLFGEGLVRSVDNFGATGDLPTHPLLLDHLAHDFMANGWSLKKLVRRLVLTRAYRLASLPAPDSHWQACHHADPDNKLLWRAHRRRLDAHALRDAMLALSGTLDPAFLGPNVQASAVDANSSGAQNLEYDYVFTDSRRSLYTPAFRNKRLDIFEVFDFADINAPIGQRTRSTIAPQALYLLNHPFVIEQSRAAAARLLTTTRHLSPEERLNHLWRAALGRLPTAVELQHAHDFISPSASDPADRPQENFALLIQSLLACADFRMLD